MTKDMKNRSKRLTYEIYLFAVYWTLYLKNR